MAKRKAKKPMPKVVYVEDSENDKEEACDCKKEYSTKKLKVRRKKV